MNDSILDILRLRAGLLCEEGTRLLREYSGMYPINAPGASIVLISPSGDHFWNELSKDGKQIQAKLLPQINRFTELILELARNLPDSSQKELERTLKEIKNAVEQTGKTWWQTTDEAAEGFRALFDTITAVYKSYFEALSSDVLVIPDSNAFLLNPDVERWRFKDVDHFTLILTPTVLSELDKHKINHKNEGVRNKASKLIRKIKEYRRRGSLHDGVTIVTDRVSLRAIAIEPNMSQTLSWFDSDIADDRFLATAIEVIRNNLEAIVFIVTADINMQNKAEMAGIPFREVLG